MTAIRHTYYGVENRTLRQAVRRNMEKSLIIFCLNGQKKSLMVTAERIGTRIPDAHPSPQGRRDVRDTAWKSERDDT